MLNQIPVLIGTFILFFVIMSKKMMPLIFTISIIGGLLTLYGEMKNGCGIIYSMMDSLIVFMMWYCIFGAIRILIQYILNGKTS